MYVVDMIAICIICSVCCILIHLVSLSLILSLFVQFTHTVHESGKYWVMEEAKTTRSSRKVSSQQDSQENPSDVVQHKYSVARMSQSTPQTSTCVGDTSLEGTSTYQLCILPVMYMYT